MGWKITENEKKNKRYELHLMILRMAHDSAISIRFLLCWEIVHQSKRKLIMRWRNTKKTFKSELKALDIKY